MHSRNCGLAIVPGLSTKQDMNQLVTVSSVPPDVVTFRGVGQRGKRGYSYNVVSMVGSVALILDPICLAVAAWLSTVIYMHWGMSLSLSREFGGDLVHGALVAVVLAPFTLYDKRFGATASRGHLPGLLRSHVLRFAMWAAVVLVLGAVSRTLDGFPSGWLALWFAMSLLLTSLTRVAVAQYMRRLQRQGVLREVIAVVGAGEVADRLVHTLCQTRRETIELLGVFDDRINRAKLGSADPAGTVSQLIELGKTRKIDWIVLALPPTAETRLLAIVARLKALAVPIGLAPQHVGSAVPYRTVEYVGDSVPVALLADRPIKRWDAVAKATEDHIPRWIITLGSLTVAAVRALVARIVALSRKDSPPVTAALSLEFDSYDVTQFVDVAANFGVNRFGYVVTPNADHLIRLHDDASFRASYAAADYVLLDSRFLSHMLRVTKGVHLPVCTGSDLTERLLCDVIAPDDALVLIGCSDEQARHLAKRYGLRRMAHFNPPMGFINDPQAIEECLRFVERHSPFRFCLLAVGAPQQEALAQRLQARGIARGLALCIGASINFLTGEESRAPVWMQRCGLEWSFRLIQAPGRMTRRYLVRGPRVFALLHRATIVLRERVPLLRPVPVSNYRMVLAVPNHEKRRPSLSWKSARVGRAKGGIRAS